MKMVNEQYEKIVKEIAENPSLSSEEKVKEAMDTGYKIAVATLSHYWGNKMGQAIAANNFYNRDPNSDETKEYMKKQGSAFNIFSGLLIFLQRNKPQDLKIQEYNVGDKEIQVMINLDDIAKEE